MQLSVLDWSLILLYILFSLGVGFFYSRRAGSSTEEYFLSGRSLPWWVIGTSMVATTFAADTPLAITEFVRGPGIWQNWFWWNQLLVGMLGVFLFSRLWRRARVLTDNELLEIRYGGKPAAILRAFKAGYFSILYNFIVMGWVINAMAAVSAVMLNIDRWVAVWACVGIALLYALLSGFWGVVVTDVVQYGIAMFGSIMLAIIAVSRVGGLDALVTKLDQAIGQQQVIEQRVEQLEQQLESAPLTQQDSLKQLIAAQQAQLKKIPDVHENTLSFVPPVPKAGFFTREFWESPFSKFLVFILVMWWSMHNTDGGGYIIQRMSAAKNEKHAMLATLWYNLNHYAFRVWPWILVAMVSLLLFPDLSQHSLGAKAGYPLVMQSVLGSGLRGILVVSFLAAFMSTIDTHLNWAASYVINDIYKRFFRPEDSFKNTAEAQRHYILVGRIATVVLMASAALVAMKMQSISKAWEFIVAMGAGIGLVLILRWFWWRINAWTEIAALATSVVITVVLEIIAAVQTYNAHLPYTLFGRPPVIFGMPLQIHHKLLIIVPISIIVWLIVTKLTAPESHETLLNFYRRVQPGGWWGPIAKEVKRDKPPVLKGFLGNWIAGLALVWGATFAIGHMVFGHWTKGLALTGISILGFLWMWRSTISKLGDD